MPKKSLVINGFLGGVNQDGDLTDLQSEDRQGRNELSVCENALCNQPGKVRAERVEVAAGGGDVTNGDSANSWAPSATDDFLIHSGNYYRQQGIYKLGEEIEYSGKNELRRPNKLSFGSSTVASSIKTGAIGLDVFGTSSATETDSLFLGKMASLGQTTGALLANATTIPGSSLANTTEYVRWIWDADDDARFELDFFNGYAKMGSFAANPDATIGFWDESASDPTNTDPNWGHTGNGAEEGSILAEGGFTSSTSPQSIAEADYIRFGKNASNYPNNDIGVIFRVGNTKVQTNNPDGLYGTDLDVTDKDIYIELQLNADNSTYGSGAGSFWNGFEHFNITLDSHKDDATIHYSDSDYDSYTKTWEITKDQLAGYGAKIEDGATVATSGGARFKVPWGAAIHTGSSFSSSSVKNVALTLVEGGITHHSTTDPVTIWVARLFEISFASADTVGWANTSSLFSQSRITKSSNGASVESLLQPYSNVLEVETDTNVRMNVYEPNDANYEGKIYYQEADDNGNGVGSVFKIADISKSKGVKSVLSEFYEPWDEFSISGCTIDASGGDNVSGISTTGLIKKGMRVTNANIPANTYVANVIDDSNIKLSTTIAGSPFTSQALKFSGKKILNISNPPVSSTYQLEAGYAEDTETINATWEHAVTVGRQIYIGNCIKTGDDMQMELSSGTPLTSNYPEFDSIGYSANATKTCTITILAATSTYKYQFTGDNLSSAQTISAGAYQDVDTSTALNAYNCKIIFPAGYSYTNGDKWTFEIKKETDLILKSAIGKRYGFSNLQYIDLELPGTGITAMGASGDRLFCFSSSQLNVVNVAQDYEFLEGTFQGHGIASSKQLVEVQEGVAFVNSTGVYYFDGNQMNNLSDDLMMTFDWSTATNIGYLPQEKLICIWHTTDDLLCYSLNTKAWVCNSINNAVPDTRIKFENNIPYWLDNTTLNKLVIADTNTNTFKIETGRISCGDLSRNKRFKKIYITIANGLEFYVSYKIDSGSWSAATDLVDGLNGVDINQNGKTIQLKIASDAAINANTVVSDITIIYRDKAIK